LSSAGKLASLTLPQYNFTVSFEEVERALEVISGSSAVFHRNDLIHQAGTLEQRGDL
jgi:hypothetical protein